MPVGTGAPAGAVRRAKWRRWVLLGSVALNLLLIGLICGAILRFGPSNPLRGLHHVAPAALVMALPEAARHSLSRSLRGIGKGAGRARVAEAASLVALLRAEPFDEAGMAQVVEAQEAGQLRRQRAARAAWRALVAGMSTAERREYADRIETLMRKRRSAKGRKDAAAPGR